MSDILGLATGHGVRTDYQDASSQSSPVKQLGFLGNIGPIDYLNTPANTINSKDNDWNTLSDPIHNPADTPIHCTSNAHTKVD